MHETTPSAAIRRRLTQRPPALSDRRPCGGVPAPCAARRAAGRLCAAASAAFALAAAAQSSPSAATWIEDFSTDPTRRGWAAFGDPSLFHWNSTGQNLAVTWDTSRPQSVFAFPIGYSLSVASSFGFALDLTLLDAAGGVQTNRPGAMQIAMGWIELAQTVSGQPGRAGGRANNLLELDWFPSGYIPGYGDVETTLSPIAFSTTGQIAASFTFPFGLNTNTPYRIAAAYDASQRTLGITVSAAGVPVAPVEPLILPASFGDLALDAFAIIVWNQASSPYDSTLAHGLVDNINLTLPSQPVGLVAMGSANPPSVQVQALTGWTYVLQASSDLARWTDVGNPIVPLSSGPLILDDPRTNRGPANYYRVRAESP